LSDILAEMIIRTYKKKSLRVVFEKYVSSNDHE